MIKKGGDEPSNILVRKEVLVIGILVIWYCFEFRISIFGFSRRREPFPRPLLGAFLIQPVLLVVADYFSSLSAPSRGEGGAVLSGPEENQVVTIFL
jgi:hypothetical protein